MGLKNPLQVNGAFEPPPPPPEVPPAALPTKPLPRLDQRREREREELARWLGMAVA